MSHFTRKIKRIRVPQPSGNKMPEKTGESGKLEEIIEQGKPEELEEEAESVKLLPSLEAKQESKSKEPEKEAKPDILLRNLEETKESEEESDPVISLPNLEKTEESESEVPAIIEETQAPQAANQIIPIPKTEDKSSLNTSSQSQNTKPRKKESLTLPQIWSDSKLPELYTGNTLLLKKGYITQNEVQSYQWLGKDWKKLASITEIWKEKGFLKPNWLKFGNQRELCSAVCRYYGIAEAKIHSVYNTGFKESRISLNGELNADMEKLKQEIIHSLTN